MFCLERIINPQSEVFNKRLQGLLDISSITTVQDEQTLLFRTNTPNASFLFNLTAPGTTILSPSSNKERFFGTGPFVLEKMVPNQEMRVRAFAEYWQGKSGFEQVSLKIITNPATRMLAFEAGQLDLAAYFPEQDALRLRDRADVRIVQQPTTRLCFLFVRVSDGPLTDPLIRQALNYALDREEIVQAVLAGQGGTVAASVFPAILPKAWQCASAAWEYASRSPWYCSASRSRAVCISATIGSCRLGEGFIARSLSVRQNRNRAQSHSDA